MLNKKSKTKYIFVVGGVMSSVGKGVAAASIGKILQSKGYRVANIKCDMYVNVDAGTIRPAEHGEVFVGEDGIEADQDLGNYERFTDQICTIDNYMTWGSVNLSVIEKERNLGYHGEDVEVVPDIPEEIIRRIKYCGKKNKADIVVTEFGGTIGEYQIMLFLEAARMMRTRDPENISIIMVGYLPTPGLLGEQKSKPTQHAVRTLNSAGITPDFILCRANQPIKNSVKETISTVCSLPRGRIISAPDVDSIYDIPLNLERENFGNILLSTLGLRQEKVGIHDWQKLALKRNRLKKFINIGIVGKYFNSKSMLDAYISVIESLKFASWGNNVQVEIKWLDAEVYEKDKKKLKELDDLEGILIPGGFGSRGTEGKILAAKYSRDHKIPYLGLCLGMQIMVIEFARNVLKLRTANSEEFVDNLKHPIIHIMEDQRKLLEQNQYGASMRLGSYSCQLVKGTKAYNAYLKAGWVKEKGVSNISERHRHRFEVNNEYRIRLEKAGLKVSGTYPNKDLVEIVEVENHPFMVGVQFHPEFKSRPLKPHPLFYEFIKAAVKTSKK